MNSVSFGRELASVLLKVFGVLLTIFLIGGVLVFFSLGFTSVSDGSCNIAVMPIEGVIMPWGYGAQYPEFTVTPKDVRDFLTLVKDDEPFIEGVLFEVNSPGGTPVAAEDIAKQIKALELPTAVLIGDMGASGGYMVSSAADKIFASGMSDVGSIGVTMSYVEESLKNKEEGLTYESLTTGKFKDAGDPNKPLSDEERAYFQAQLDAVNTEFINLVANNRGLEPDAVRALADGSTLVGQKAVDAKLIDQVGDREAVKNYFAEKLGKDVSEISFCEYFPPLF
jgi:signal peptide peptidase SppA